MCRSLRFRRLLKLQDMASYDLELLFDNVTEERISLISQSCGDLCPVLRLQRLDRGRKEVTLFLGHMMPFLLDEVSNDVIDGLPQEFPISQHTFDCPRDPAQTFGAPAMIGREIADPRRRGGI